MKLLAAVIATVAVCAVACGGSNSSNGNKAIAISPDNADSVAHAALPALEDLPGAGWQVTSRDAFDNSEHGASDNLFSEIENTPECETLQNLATLEGVFGGSLLETDKPLGRAQVQFAQQTPDGLPTTVNVDVDVADSAVGSGAQFTIVKDLFGADSTSNCVIAMLDRRFSEGNSTNGLKIEVTKATGLVETPEDGAQMAFDINLSAGANQLQMGLELYFWPYGNANVEALFLGPKQALTPELVAGVLNATDRNLKAAAYD